MRKLLCLLYCLPVMAYSQVGQPVDIGFDFYNRANGRAFRPDMNFAVEGSYFLPEEACLANIKVRNGKTYNGIKCVINLLDNTLIYEDKNGEQMVAEAPIERIEFTYCSKFSVTVFRSGYPAAGTHTTSSFYQLLDSGKVSLLKYYRLDYKDSKEYGSALTKRIFKQEPEYYVYSAASGIYKLSKKENSVTDVLNDKRQQVQEYINKNNLRMKREEDMVKLFNYYNSL